MITVYIDVLFIVNFIVNILILEGTALIMREDIKALRTVISASTGAVYAVIIFFVELTFLQSSILKLLVSAMLVFLGFNYKCTKHFVKMLAGFYVVSLIFGGGVIALMSMTNIGIKTGAIYSNGAVYLSLPWQMLLSSSAITYFLIMVFSRIRKKKIHTEAIERKLSIYIQGNRIDVNAIIDTGNNLCDPISGMPVIICEYSKIEAVLPKEDVSLIEKLVKAEFKIRMIPFSSVGKEKGVMVGFIPDRIEVDSLEAKKCVVGICETALSLDADYHALLNPMMKIEKKTVSDSGKECFL